MAKTVKATTLTLLDHPEKKSKANKGPLEALGPRNYADSDSAAAAYNAKESDSRPPTQVYREKKGSRRENIKGRKGDGRGKSEREGLSR